jgi:TetR/AcrR family transcriptional regulator, transcriptional repressor for nem operon
MIDSRERLIEAAWKLFFAGSFHNVGIAEICSAADVNKGTFYHFFPSKIDLLLAVMDRYAEDVRSKYDALAKKKESPARKIRSIFVVPQKDNEKWKSEYGAAPGCFLGNMILELAASEPVIRDKAKSLIKTWQKAIEPIVEEFFLEEKIRNLETAATAEVLLGISQGANVMAKAKNDPLVFRAYANLAVELIRAAADPK